MGGNQREPGCWGIHRAVYRRRGAFHRSSLDQTTCGSEDAIGACRSLAQLVLSTALVQCST